MHDILKSLVTLFLFSTTGLVLAWSRRPLVAALAHASLAIGAIGLVYLDVLAAPFLIGAAWALAKERRAWALALFTLACAIKWQPFMAAPFVLVYACASRPGGTSMWRAIARFAIVPGAIAIVLLAIFGHVMFNAFYHAAEHRHVSAQGANVGWILTWLLHVGVPATFGPIDHGRSIVIVPQHSIITTLQKAMCVGVYLLVLVRYARSGDRSIVGLVRAALAGYLIYFLLNAGVHENHLQIALVFALVLAALDSQWIWAACALALCSNANLIGFYGVDGSFRVHVWFGVDATVWLAVAVTLAIVRMLPLLLRRTPVTRARPLWSQ